MKLHAQELIENLFSDHFYSKTGMGLIRQGTPTNNTGEEASGYTWYDDADDSFDRIFKKSEGFVNTGVFNEKSRWAKACRIPWN